MFFWQHESIFCAIFASFSFYFGRWLAFCTECFPLNIYIFCRPFRSFLIVMIYLPSVLLLFCRMEMQKELSKLKGAKKDKAAGFGANQSGTTGAGASGSGGKNPEDDNMLDITLGMLRCSVCKDRFKSAAITRYELCTRVISETPVSCRRHHVLFVIRLSAGASTCSARSASTRTFGTARANARPAAKSSARMTLRPYSSIKWKMLCDAIHSIVLVNTKATHYRLHLLI